MILKFKVRIFMGGQQVEPSVLPTITISNPTIDRIVNAIVERNDTEHIDREEQVS